MNKKISIQQIETFKKEGDCSITEIEGKTGKMVRKSYDVFPGIRMIFDNVKMQQFEDTPSEEEQKKNVYEINHCSEGRIESSVGDHFFYLTKGDLSIHKRSVTGKSSYFPTSNYQGVSILIDLDSAPKCFSCLLNDVNVHPATLMKKFCRNDSFFVVRSNEHLEHVFSELYHIPKDILKGYLKIKILEICLFLSALSTKEEQERKAFSASQVTLAKQVCKFLTAHIEDRMTIEDLSNVFHVSQTQLKNCFKGVYGISVYSYIRAQKMQSAAAMLLNTDKTVLEIANLHSYDNASKFAKAFSDVMGTSPTEYRKAKLQDKL